MCKHKDGDFSESEKNQNDKNNIKIDNPANVVSKWWRNRSYNQKKFAGCFLITAVLGLILFTVWYFVFKDHHPLCKDYKCQKLSNEILTYVDETTRPCDDFYKFTCGRFLKKAIADDPYTIKSVKQNMEEEIQLDIRNMLEEPINPADLASYNLAKKFYRMCINTEAVDHQGLDKIRLIFQEINGWPILEGDLWQRDRFNWTESIKNLRNLGVSVDFFMDIYVDVDKKNPHRYILVISDKFYKPSEIADEARNNYLDYMVDVALQFDPQTRTLRRDMNEVLEFILRLGKISQEAQQYNDQPAFYTVSKLQYAYKSIQWFKLIQGVLGEAAMLSFSDEIKVPEPTYLKKLESLLKFTQPRILANFMGWQILQNLINFMPTKVLDKAYEFLAKTNGRFTKMTRWNLCVTATRQKLSPPINLKYTDRYFDPQTKDHVTTLIRNVKNRFKQKLWDLDWIDHETKHKVRSSLLSSMEKIYYVADMEAIMDEDSVYYNIDLPENDFLQAVLDLDVIKQNLRFEKLRVDLVTDDWVRQPDFISGLKVKYSPSENMLKFPLGLFRGLFYNRTRPEYMNYGLLGSVIAHQISHIFVDAEYDNDTMDTMKLMQWWTPQSTVKYHTKLECLGQQYKKFHVPELGGQVNTINTRDEDVADVAGYKVAYETYANLAANDPMLPDLKYNPKQMFWISSALQFCSRYPVGYFRKKYSGDGYRHSPNMFRVNGPLQNLPEFSKDFGCEKGSYMNPDYKCYIW